MPVDSSAELALAWPAGGGYRREPSMKLVEFFQFSCFA
jgi:hypothetical protein